MMENRFRRCSIWLLLVGATSATGIAAAHHSFAATYDASREARIEGEVAQFLVRNPHSMVHVLAPDEAGNMQRWAIEWAGVNVLTGQGISRETLRSSPSTLAPVFVSSSPVGSSVRR